MMMNVEANMRNEHCNSKALPILKLPDLIDKLAKEGDVIRWDAGNKWFEVIDAKGFECKFNALRCIRGKRKENTADRPFARMHVHFVLVRGEKWAGIGSAFRPKKIVDSEMQERRPLLWKEESSTFSQMLDFNNEDKLLSSFKSASKRLKCEDLGMHQSSTGSDTIHWQQHQKEGVGLVQVINLNHFGVIFTGLGAFHSP